MKRILLCFAILLSACTLMAQENLVAFYPFSGNANDESGNAYHGTVSGATLATDRFGNENSCYYFDGDDYITVEENSSFNVSSSGFTFSVWALADTGQNVTWANIASCGGERKGGYSVIYIEPWNSLANVRLYNNSSNTSSLFIDSDHLNPDIWNMYTFTFKDGTYKMFFNGVLIEQTPATSYSSAGNHLVIGASRNLGDHFKGWIDEVVVYNRALSEMEVARLSGLPGAVRAVELDAYALTDFEIGAVEPQKYSDYWALWGGDENESYITCVENPVKEGANTSDYTGVAVTFPSNIDGFDSHKMEYVLTSEDGTLFDHHHIMKWKQLFADSSILQLDNITWNWMSINQIHGGFGLYDDGECENGGSIAYGGGIFNDVGKMNNPDPSVYCLRYRAMPDSARVPFHIDVGKWMSFTYEIFWTKSDSGYWRVWKDGELLGSASDVKTLPDCCGEDGDFLQFKTGLYNKWWDAEIDSLPLYIDDLELYIGEEKRVSDVCPECDIPWRDKIVAEDTLIAWYPFNGNADDESGSNLFGTVCGATLAPDRFGNENSCFYFDGDAHIEVEEHPAFNANASGFTFSAWALADTGQDATWANIASFGGWGQGGYSVQYIEPWNGLSAANLYSQSGTSSYFNIDSVHLNPEIWNMYTFTYKSGIYKVFFNGVLLSQTEAEYFKSTGNDFIIGASNTRNDHFKGWIDEVRVYNRALSDLEVARLSGLSGAVRATELDAYALSDFELGALEPLKFSDDWDVPGLDTDPESYIACVENPVKSGANTSEFVGMAVTFPSNTPGNDSHKKEYVFTSEEGLLDDHHHIMQWKLLFADSSILQPDNYSRDWMSLNQIHGGCEFNDGGACENGGSIAYEGGIFNDCVKASSADPSEYQFRYRALPDSALVPFRIDIGEWMSFTYEIFWTHSDSGYWRVWKDGELLGSAFNVRTRPECCDAEDNFLQFKTGLCNKWNDTEIDSLTLYFDNLELFIGENILVEDVCPECDITVADTTVSALGYDRSQGEVKIFPNPVNDLLHIEGKMFPSEVSIYSIDGRRVMYVENTGLINLSHLKNGIYLVSVKTKDAFIRRKIMKL